MRWFDQQSDTDGKTKRASQALAFGDKIGREPLSPLPRIDAFAEVDAYWNAMRADRLMPDRSDIDPRGILGALPQTFLLERVAPGLARFRIAGSKIDNLMGINLRGLPISCLLSAASRPQFSELLEDVMRRPATAHLTLTGLRGLGKPCLDAQMILMPLRADSGAVDQVLGCLAVHGQIGRLPRRFEVTGSVMRKLRQRSQTRPAFVTDLLTQSLPRNSAPPDRLRPPVGTKLTPTKAPHLFLVSAT